MANLCRNLAIRANHMRTTIPLKTSDLSQGRRTGASEAWAENHCLVGRGYPGKISGGEG